MFRALGFIGSSLPCANDSCRPASTGGAASPGEVRLAGVKIIWNAAPGKEVAGYRIYRRLSGEDTPVRIGEVGVPTTIFDDRTPPESPSWFYSVSSIDAASPVNESPASAEVEVVQ